MKQLIYILLSFLLTSFYLITEDKHHSSFMAQSWNIRLNQSSIDCGSNQVCYQVALQSASGMDWALGDQNYRLFFDGDLMTINTVTSLLPSSIYSAVTVHQNVKITGQGQEPFSPLDDIDDNLGFLDFSIIENDKSNPSAATQILSASFMPVAEICLTTDPSVMNSLSTSNNCLSFYHSRPSTAGAITSQYTTVSENNLPGSTIATTGISYEDLIASNTTDACPGLNCTCSAVAQTLSP